MSTSKISCKFRYLLLCHVVSSVVAFVDEAPWSADQFNYVVVEQDGWPSWEQLVRFHNSTHYLYNSSHSRTPIYVASIFSPLSMVFLTEPGNFTYLNELFGMEYALRFINDASHLLGGYELRVIHRESEVRYLNFQVDQT